MDNMRTDEITNAIYYLDDFDSYSEYQQNLNIVLHTLDRALTRYDTLKESYNFLSDKYCSLLGKRTPKKPKFKPYEVWNGEYYCPICNKFLGFYHNKHEAYCSDCGQAIDWEDDNEDEVD